MEKKNSGVAKDNIKSGEHLEISYLSPDKIITLNDFPVHSIEALKGYFLMCQKGLELPPVPVIRKEAVEPFLEVSQLKELEMACPEAEYFMLDGSHRTTAQTLQCMPIPVIIIESNGDIEKALIMEENGVLYGLTIGENLEKCIGNLVNHFSRKPGFKTVLDKTRRMVAEKAIPGYMIYRFNAVKNK